MQEEVDQKTIALAVKTGKLTGQVLQAAMKKFLAARQKGKAKPHHGHQSLRQLKKDGSALSNIEITDANIGLFRPCAKKYDIDYTLRKDSSTHPPRYIVIFKTKQADNLEQAFKEFTAKKLNREERPSIRKALSALKQKAAAKTQQRAKEKVKERGCRYEARGKKADPVQSPVPDFRLSVWEAGAGIPAGGRCGLVGKAAAFHGRLFGGLCKRRPQLPPF